MKTPLLLLVLFAWAGFVLAQDSSIYFEKLYDYHKGADLATSMVTNADSTFVIIGTSLDPQTFDRSLLFRKFDRFGNVISKKTYHKSGYQFYTGYPGCLISTNDGGFAFGGALVHLGDNEVKSLLIKFNSSGDTEYMRTYGDTAFEAFYGTVETPTHEFILVGETFNNGAINGATYLVKTDSFGNILWQKVYYSGFEESCSSISIDSHDNYALGGGVLANFPFYIPLFYVVDSSGNVLKRKIISSGAEAIGGIQFSKALDNNYIVYGALDTTIHSGDYKFPRFVAKYDSNLNESWKVIFNDPIENGIFQARQFSDSTVVAVGFQGDEVTGAANGLLAKISNSGKLEWKREYYYRQLWKGAPLFNYFYDIQQARDKGFLICGFADDSSNISNQDIWLVKLDSNGCLQPGCDTTITGIIVVSDSKSELKLFPNPATNEINISFPFSNNIITISDLFGRELKQWKIESGKLKMVDVSFLQQGVYVVEIKDERGNLLATQKLFKQ